MSNWIPKIAMCTALALGDLARHGTSQEYTVKSKTYKQLLTKDHQTIASDNRTQGIVEKEMLYEFAQALCKTLNLLCKTLILYT